MNQKHKQILKLAPFIIYETICIAILLYCVIEIVNFQPSPESAAMYSWDNFTFEAGKFIIVPPK